jgi:hypothetical protein
VEAALEADDRRTASVERANLIAFSIASAPELKNPVRVSPAMGANAASRSARAT